MNRDTGDWHRLAEHVVERRESLGMTQQDLQAAGGPSPATQRHIEGAHQTSYKSWIIRSVERALRWERGSVAAILAGGEPTPTGPRMPTPREHLANAMQSRIDELGLDPAILRSVIVEGIPLRRKWRDLEDELRWADGSIEALLDGREPTTLQTGAPDRARQVPGDLSSMSAAEIVALGREMLANGQRLIELGEQMLDRERGDEQDGTQRAG